LSFVAARFVVCFFSIQQFQGNKTLKSWSGKKN